MKNKVENIAALIRLNGGQIVGKTRLQKIVYLLEAKGLGFDFDYDYHNYGPYSAELAFATDDAESLAWLVKEDRRGTYGVPYTTFKSTEHSPRFEKTDKLEPRRAALQIMNSASSIVLELAATAIYLQRHGYKNYWSEVRRRKSNKATPEHIEEASRLLQQLGFPAQEST